MNKLKLILLLPLVYATSQTLKLMSQFWLTWHTVTESLSKPFIILYINQNRDLDSAVELYEKCLTINPKNPATYTALGFTYHLKAEFRQALNCYHKASFLKNEDSLNEELVQRALQDINEFPIELAYL
jgi:tetratricopeptide (TPR) repeat protein